jgi:hypothetical protein
MLDGYTLSGGVDQLTWLKAALTAAQADGVTWKVIVSSSVWRGDRGKDSGAIQIDVNAVAKTFTRLSGSFLSDGFNPGDKVVMSGHTPAGNNGEKMIQTISGSGAVITVEDGSGLVDSTGSGDERVLRLWGIFKNDSWAGFYPQHLDIHNFIRNPVNPITGVFVCSGDVHMGLMDDGSDTTHVVPYGGISPSIPSLVCPKATVASGNQNDEGYWTVAGNTEMKYGVEPFGTKLGFVILEFRITPSPQLLVTMYDPTGEIARNDAGDADMVMTLSLPADALDVAAPGYPLGMSARSPSGGGNLIRRSMPAPRERSMVATRSRFSSHSN